MYHVLQVSLQSTITYIDVILCVTCKVRDAADGVKLLLKGTPMYECSFSFQRGPRMGLKGEGSYWQLIYGYCYPARSTGKISPNPIQNETRQTLTAKTIHKTNLSIIKYIFSTHSVLLTFYARHKFSKLKSFPIGAY